MIDDVWWIFDCLINDPNVFDESVCSQCLACKMFPGITDSESIPDLFYFDIISKGAENFHAKKA